jgi:PHD/YefM family antitoxin component YafN of YafNO toxin-antitoxin module
MTSISANDLKVKGIAAIEAALAGQSEALVSVRGKDRFVVMDLSHYRYLRECELETALAQARADLVAGRCVAESADAHLDRIEAELDAEPTTAPSGRE